MSELQRLNARETRATGATRSYIPVHRYRSPLTLIVDGREKKKKQKKKLPYCNFGRCVQVGVLKGT